ncbi:rRNA (cytidine-2'-O-)-methyltransferase, partial [bacterium]|nr:rRNA (cytidine-2'-O-)-methyltransferase [bacterium]
GVSDPLYYLVTRAINEGITVIPIPGASSLLAGIVVSGLPNDRFVFEGFLPPKKGRKTKIAELEQEKRTIVLFESPHRLLRTLRDLKEVFGSRRISIGRELTKIYEEVIRTDLGEALEIFSEKKPRGEFVLIIEGKR